MEEKELQNLLNEAYKLGYEDAIDDIIINESFEEKIHDKRRSYKLESLRKLRNKYLYDPEKYRVISTIIKFITINFVAISITQIDSICTIIEKEITDENWVWIKKVAAYITSGSNLAYIIDFILSKKEDKEKDKNKKK